MKLSHDNSTYEWRSLKTTRQITWNVLIIMYKECYWPIDKRRMALNNEDLNLELYSEREISPIQCILMYVQDLDYRHQEVFGGKTQANKLNVQVIKHSMLSRQESIVQLVHNSTTKRYLLYLMSTCNKMNMYFWLVVLRTYVLMTYFIFFLVKITVMSYLWKKTSFLVEMNVMTLCCGTKHEFNWKSERERAILFTDH